MSFGVVDLFQEASDSEEVSGERSLSEGSRRFHGGFHGSIRAD